MKIVCLSDTHMSHEDVKIPDGDVLIHSGDATCSGNLVEVSAFCEWFRKFPHKHKIFVAGNHDWLFQDDPGIARQLTRDFHYLQDSSIEIEGLKFYGSPWTPRYGWWAFMVDGEDLKRKWDMIPQDVDVLITHGPPDGILDMAGPSRHAGCNYLRDALVRVHPKLHIFGHIHYGHGELIQAGTHFVNAAICDDYNNKLNEPVVVEI